MPRTVKPWQGKTDDSPIPPRVRLRVFRRFGGICQGPCHRKIGPADKWILEHEKAIILGGENRESNLSIRCDWCAKQKTAIEVEAKAITDKIAKRHVGIKKESTFPSAEKLNLKWNWSKRRYEPTGRAALSIKETE